MHIIQEDLAKQSIRSYSANHINVDGINYQHSIIINRQTIIPNWPILCVGELYLELLTPLLALQPEIILIGHNSMMVYPPIATLELLSKQRIGIECMSIGAASSTYNLLLNEGRNIVVGFILPMKKAAIVTKNQ